MSYVGNSADKARILKQEKEREEQRRTYEDARNKTAAGLRQFGAGTSEVCRVPCLLAEPPQLLRTRQKTRIHLLPAMQMQATEDSFA